MLTFSVEQALQYLLSEHAEGWLPPLITISGGTRSGKSYFSEKLHALLNEHGVSATLIGLDDYFRNGDDKELPRTDDGSPIFDLPTSYHREEFVAQVSRLLQGEDILSPCYDKRSCTRLTVTPRALHPATTIIAEGLFVGTFFKEYPHVLHVFMDTDKRLCLKRRIANDTVEYGVSREKVEDRFFRKVLPYWNTHIEPQRMFAQLIIKH